jgi:hypothetical protein
MIAEDFEAEVSENQLSLVAQALETMKLGPIVPIVVPIQPGCQ